jgi:hypothetical protein
MNTSVRLLAAQRENIDPFGFQGLPHGFGDGVNHTLQCKILVQRKVPGHLFAVSYRRNECVAIHRGEPIQEDDGFVIAPHHMMCRQSWISPDKAANEAAPSDLVEVAFQVETLAYPSGTYAGRPQRGGNDLSVAGWLPPELPTLVRFKSTVVKDNELVTIGFGPRLAALVIETTLVTP